MRTKTDCRTRTHISDSLEKQSHTGKGGCSLYDLQTYIYLTTGHRTCGRQLGKSEPDDVSCNTASDQLTRASKVLRCTNQRREWSAGQPSRDRHESSALTSSSARGGMRRCLWMRSLHAVSQTRALIVCVWFLEGAPFAIRQHHPCHTLFLNNYVVHPPLPVAVSAIFSLHVQEASQSVRSLLP